MTATVIEAFVKIAVLIGGLMTAAAYFVLLERWIAAWVQDRIGPNRVGPFGFLQPLADGLKFILKEEATPAHVDKVVYTIAPLSILAAALASFAVIPFGSVLPEEASGLVGLTRQVHLIVAPAMDVGLIYIFALSSIAVYGVILGAWASNNKYSFLGGLRSSAQLIAYELPLGLGILGVVLMAGSLRLEDIIRQQAESGMWNVFVQPLGFIVFLVAAFAESARLPFDLPEAEQELIGGYHTEYAGMRLLMYLIAEFLHMITASFLIVILFLGGWHVPWFSGAGDDISWVSAVGRILVLLVKTFVVILFFMMARWSWPRFRFDQLMALAWKTMLPLGIVNLVIVATAIEFFSPQLFGDDFVSRMMVLAGIWIVTLACWIIAFVSAPLATDNRPRIDTLLVDRGTP